jgi:molybdate transport system substrate-binding protein
MVSDGPPHGWQTIRSTILSQQPQTQTPNMKNQKTLLAAAIMLLIAAQLRAAQVTVFAAASLTDSLKQIAANYEKTSGDKMVFNFAASGTLSRQIEAGAPADIFFAADETKADGLEKKGLLVSETRKSLLGNVLVMVTPTGATAIHSPAELTNAAVQHIAIGEVKNRSLRNVREGIP